MKTIIKKLERDFQLKIQPKFNLDSTNEALGYFNKNVIDSYHLGGGLSSVIENQNEKNYLRLIGSKNVYIISNGILERAGYVNPTYLLLSISQKLINDIFD